MRGKSQNTNLTSAERSPTCSDLIDIVIFRNDFPEWGILNKSNLSDNHMADMEKFVPGMST
jgi:hypothetical protein